MKNWYQELIKKNEEIENLNKKLEAFKEILSPYTIPDGFKVFSDDDVAFSYPKIWKKEPVSMKIQGLFRENVDDLAPEDDFPSQYMISVTGIGNNKLPLKGILLTIKDAEIEKKIAEKMGFLYPFSEQALQAEIPIEIIFPLLGFKGNNKKEIYYHLMENYLSTVFNNSPIKEIEFIDGEESLSLEFSQERKGKDPIITYAIFTFLPKQDSIFSFSFSDNLKDKEKIIKLKKQVISSIKFGRKETNPLS